MYFVRAFCRDYACAVGARNAPCGVRGVMIHDKDFCAGKKRFKRPSQPQSIIRGVQQRRDWRHRRGTSPHTECTTKREGRRAFSAEMDQGETARGLFIERTEG